MAPQASRSGGFSQVDLLVAIIVIGLVVGLALPGFLKAKDKALEVEVKVNLWVLQVALERYASDTNGLYPPFILGGSPRSLACASAAGCLGGVPVPDPLLVAGYISTYPPNPFAHEVADICAWTEGDPRFGCLGKALGQEGNLTTGNALSDPNYATSDIAIFPGTLGPEGNIICLNSGVMP
ncbi:type II secretion system protein [bacterium]|nr:type II secretion system protein [bacterium]